MAKIKDPVLFSTYFDVGPIELKRLGVFDPVLNADTQLFIDPLLLEKSRHEEIRVGARSSWVSHFEGIVKLLRASKSHGDIAWRNARKRFAFHEITGTCLGYGSNTIRGSGFGATLTDRMLDTASQIIAMGVEDPDLFVLMSLFEEGIGPDRISDMTTNVVAKDLVAFTSRICVKLDVPTEPFRIGNHYGNLPINPTQRTKSPVILVPTDVLRELPVALCRDDISRVAFENEMLRQGVSSDLGRIWQAKTKREKADLRKYMLADPRAFQALVSTAHNASKDAYDGDADPAGVIVWRPVRESVARDYPLSLALPKTPDAQGLLDFVKKIIEQFKILVEDKGLWKLMYHNDVPRPEHNSQMLFFAVADAYCKANNIDLSPEVDSGNGPVDFKLSHGHDAKVLVEVKLSKNTKLVAGYTKQLEAYKEAEETTKAVYLVIDVGQMGAKAKQLALQQSQQRRAGFSVSDIVIVDATQQLSASKR